jgi:cytochrome c
VWIALVAVTGVLSAEAMAESPGLGKRLGEADIPVWARYVMTDGTGLPPGRGTVSAGRAIFERDCASCHGKTGAEGPIQPMVGPPKSYAKPAGAHWPHATSMFDYIRRAMPFTAPKSLSDSDVYAVTAWILHRNGIIAEDAVLDAKTLPKIEMPNRVHFIDLWSQQGGKPY